MLRQRATEADHLFAGFEELPFEERARQLDYLRATGFWDALDERPQPGQAPVADEGAPLSPLPDMPTVKVVTPSEAEMAEMMERRRQGGRRP